jgi:hypothetical protein
MKTTESKFRRLAGKAGGRQQEIRLKHCDMKKKT